MVESYVVETRLEVKNLLAAALRKNAEEARALSDQMEKLRGVQSFTKLTDVVGRLNERLGTAATAAIKMGDSLAKGADVAVRGLTSAADQAERLERALAGAERAGRAVGNVRMAAGGGGSVSSPVRPPASSMPAPWRPGATTTPRPSNNNAPHTPISIPDYQGPGSAWYHVHTGNVPPRPPMPPATGGAGGGASGSGGQGSGFDLLASGVMLDYAGRSMLDAAMSPVQAGAALQAARMALQRQLGSSPTAGADYDLANQAALATATALPSTTLAQNIGALGDIYSVVGSMKEAAAFLTPMAQFATVSAAINPGRTADPYLAVRSGEMLGQSVNAKTGALDPSRLLAYLGLLERAEVATHGKVNELQMLNFAQTGGMAAKNMTATGMLQMIPVINELGGFRAGTALQSMYANVISGVMPQRVADLWEHAGLLNGSMVHATRTGIRLDPGAVKGGDVFQQNPVAWVEQFLIPTLEKEGKSRAEMQTAITMMFSRQTGQRAAGMMAGQLMQIQKDYLQEMQAMPTAAAVSQLYAQGYSQNLLNLQGAWNTLLQQLGTTLLPTLVPLMQSLTKGIQALTADVSAHPNAARDLVLLGGALGGIAVAGGSAAIALGSVRLALEGIAGLRLAAVATAGGGTTAVRVAAGLAAGNPVGAAAVGAAVGLAVLDHVVTNSAPPNIGLPRAGYHSANSPKVQIGDRAAPTPNGGPRHDGVGRSVHRFESEPITVNVTTHLTASGRKLAAVVTQHQVEAARRPTKGRSSFDDTQAPALPSHSTALN